jgi:hypothetical protein
MAVMPIEEAEVAQYRDPPRRMRMGGEKPGQRREIFR